MPIFLSRIVPIYEMRISVINTSNEEKNDLLETLSEIFAFCAQKRCERRKRRSRMISDHYGVEGIVYEYTTALFS